MTDLQTPSTPSPSPQASLLFAMGKLTEASNTQKEETARLRADQADLPTRVVTLLQPELTRINGVLTIHGRDIESLKKWKWVQTGGLGLAIVAVGWAVELIKPIQLLAR